MPCRDREEPAAMPGIPVSAELGQGVGERREHGRGVRRWEVTIASSRPTSPSAAAAVAAARSRRRAEPDVAGQHDLRRVAADVAAVGVQDSRLRANSSGVPPTKFQCWAKRAAVRSVRRSPLPPMQIGGWGAAPALGLAAGVGQLVVRALESRRLLRQQADETSHASSNRSLRSPGCRARCRRRRTPARSSRRRCPARGGRRR